MMSEAAVTSSALQWADIVSTTITGVAWPVALVILTFIFRNEIQKKFQDIEEAGPGGVKFRQLQLQTSEPEPTSPLPMPKRILTPFQELLRAPILADLQRFEGDENKISVLVDELAITRALRHFESAFAQIFGSQIAALEELNASGGSTSLARAKEFFEGVRKSEPEFYATASFDDWARYLTITGFVEADGENVSITPAGRDFLQFVRSQKFGQKRHF